MMHNSGVKRRGKAKRILEFALSSVMPRFERDIQYSRGSRY